MNKTNKINKLLILLPLFILLSCLISCNNTPITEPEKTPISGEGTATILLDPNGGIDLPGRVYYIGEIPSEIPETTKKGYNLLGWTTEKDTKTFYDFTKPIYEDITLYAYWESKIKDYSYYLDEYIPDVIDHNIDNLPEEDGDAILMWGSSDVKLFNTSGVINRPRNDAPITIILQVYVDHQIIEYTKDAVIKAVDLKKLPESNLVFGYYSSWNFHGVTKEILETVDVINLSFAYVTNNFELLYSDLIHVIPKLIECHSYGVRVVVSVQGYSSEGHNFSEAAKTGAGRKHLAENMLNFIEKYNFDGIDIDWEYPGYNTGTKTEIDRQNYTLLCKQIKDTLKARNEDYIISAAIPGGPYTTPRFDLKTLGNILDYIHIMTYDLETSSKATHHTALYPSSNTVNQCTVHDSVNIYLNNGVPASKLCIGIAFYGKYFGASDMGQPSSSHKNVTYSKIKKDYLSRLGTSVKYCFDNVSMAPYLIDSLNNQVIDV